MSKYQKNEAVSIYFKHCQVKTRVPPLDVVFLLFRTSVEYPCTFSLSFPLRPTTSIMASARSSIYQDLSEEHPRKLIPELCKQFYNLGWVTGTGGGISIKLEQALADSLSKLQSGGGVLSSSKHFATYKQMSPRYQLAILLPFGYNMRVDPNMVVDTKEQFYRRKPPTASSTPNRCVP
ncbi:hypothetical protein pipiens_013517 [Culex pipiens pipiens]|uniref:Uncharacterized protein n=1 Tax=Culex pipiens pipiens TaxID=38569 RepID=A0ABD1D0N4_CULPP